METYLKFTTTNVGAARKALKAIEGVRVTGTTTNMLVKTSKRYGLAFDIENNVLSTVAICDFRFEEDFVVMLPEGPLPVHWEDFLTESDPDDVQTLRAAPDFLILKRVYEEFLAAILK